MLILLATIQVMKMLFHWQNANGEQVYVLVRCQPPIPPCRCGSWATRQARSGRR